MGRAKYVVELAEEERVRLRSLLRGGKASVRMVTRARVLLKPTQVDQPASLDWTSFSPGGAPEAPEQYTGLDQPEASELASLPLEIPGKGLGPDTETPDPDSPR